ncbi:TSL-kinase interacting protein 1-like isoform X1 [Populus alba x Populus x berolinensis]|uniref:TSL-kinase interacting protein 1-like isoform X1 n=1 Tax=Populus alba x Populus x berolinensis TaxID=444605 RepID=A0AAD6LK18_9ROSI|nr:TSL-kinase interacting protein 1-like isoform X1 [Populus alba x Populus x berolinensis]
MEARVSLDSEQQLLQNGSIQDGDSGVTSSTPDCVETRQPEKRPTRQWAAWTRQEEESFFTALRQVGKNFEKITHHVQSKNKDQVRHYYYRLVRRMNKLLGPGLCLDAKNSKDTNAAMLRWWSLLEKYSCKASKLHLKPRRFKIFIEALENQLLKDQRKNVRKRSSQGENGSPTTPSIITNQNRAAVHDTRTVKLVIVDSQNIQKLGGKGSLKRNVNMGVVRNNNKGDSTAMKPARQRRKPVSSAAYKKWEKAAIAGVSLVADAAEHLERTATDKEDEHDQGKKGLDPVEKLLPHFHPSLRCVESNALTNMKLKLQLFPIDDGTRRALEMDKHNPHLELTLSTRKKISSVLEHLNRKWGDSTVASGELMLFPYGVNRENLVGYQRWTQDSLVSAADVYFSIGSPPVFRLRYGWFSNVNFASVTLQAPSTYSCLPVGGNEKEQTMDSVSTAEPSTSDQFEKPENPCRDCPTSENNNHASILHSAGVTNENNEFVATGPRNNLVKSFDPAANISLHRKETDDRTNTQQLEDVDGLRLSNVNPLSAGEWADSLTNVGIGDLLSELPHVANHNCIEPLIVQSNQCLQEIPFSCDSFDAAIAAHISRHQGKMGFHSTVTSHTSSIWDGEETCDAFAFQKNHSLRKEVTTSSAVASPRVSKQIDRTSSIASSAFLEELPVIEGPNDYPTGGDPMDECSSDSQVVSNQVRDFNGLTDIYWVCSFFINDFFPVVLCSIAP